VREGKGTANFLGEEDNNHNADQYPPETAGFAASNNGPADGSGKLKSSQLSSPLPMAAYMSQQIQLLQYRQNRQLSPGPRWLSSCFKGKISFPFSFLPQACFRGELRPLAEL